MTESLVEVEAPPSDRRRRDGDDRRVDLERRDGGDHRVAQVEAIIRFPPLRRSRDLATLPSESSVPARVNAKKNDARG
jgi:hypothetical protein